MSGRAMRLVLNPAMQAADYRWKLPAEIHDMIVDGTRVGHVSLRLGDDPDLVRYAGHVGYRVGIDHQGHGYAEQGVRLILPVAKARGLATVWFTCNPDNFASMRTLEKLGAIYVDTVDLPKGDFYYRRGDRQKRRYRINP